MASVTESARTQRSEDENHLFSSSDDDALVKQVLPTHAPDGREIDVKSLLQIVEDVLQRAAFTVSGSTPGVEEPHMKALDDKMCKPGYGIGDAMEASVFYINRISSEITYRSFEDAPATTLEVFFMVANFAWDAKVVLCLAAFAVYYAEYWLVAQLSPTNALAKSVAIFKIFPINEDLSNPKYKAISNLMKVIINVTKCIVEFNEIVMNISPDRPVYEISNVLIQTAAYWIIRSIVVCASLTAGLTGSKHENLSSTEAGELSSLAQKVNSIYQHLKTELDYCHQLINQNKHIGPYEQLVRLFETPQADNMKILRALIDAKDKQQLPLFDCFAKKRASLNVLQGKYVLLLISELDHSDEYYYENLSIIHQVFQKLSQRRMGNEQYEILWLPVLDSFSPWTEQKQQQFEDHQSKMPWYTIYHPSLLEAEAKRYIKEVWGFANKLIVVVLDPQGSVANSNALHMISIWGPTAFPFTHAKEEALWKDESWTMELLVDGIDAMILNWISEGKHICLYGGEDMEWIQRFTKAAKVVAERVGISLEMVYVGKSMLRKKVYKNIAAICDQNLSHVIPDMTLVWFFWQRLESMCFSRMPHVSSVENDPIMQEIMTLLSFDESDQGWAVFSRGSRVIARDNGDILLKCLENFEEWEEKAKKVGLLEALQDNLRELHTPRHCNHLILPADQAAWNTPKVVICADCGRSMEKLMIYQCPQR